MKRQCTPPSPATPCTSNVWQARSWHKLRGDKASKGTAASSSRQQQHQQRANSTLRLLVIALLSDQLPFACKWPSDTEPQLDVGDTSCRSTLWPFQKNPASGKKRAIHEILSFGHLSHSSGTRWYAQHHTGALHTLAIPGCSSMGVSTTTSASGVFDFAVGALARWVSTTPDLP